MAVSTNKALLFLAGGVAAAAVVAYSAGAFDPLLKRPETIAALPDAGEAEPKQTPAVEPPAAASPGQPSEPAAATPVEPPATAAPEAEGKPAVVPPSFDVVRVEGDGSIVIAGKAVPEANVDLLVGSNVIGSTKAGADGDFAVVLDDPLKPGNYQIVLRATAPDNVVAMSVETAVVSIPETPEGQVLALVEEPGKPSQMITLPKPQAPAAEVKQPETAAAPAVEAPAAEAPAAAAPGAEPKPEGEMQAALPQQAEPAPQPAAPVAGPTVRVEAVEIDGRKIFVAGSADPGRTVRGYANEILLGDAKASPDGRYLIEADRDLPVGDYIIRVDALEPDGVKVAARAAVPFEREPGETLAAVAPPAEQPAPPAQPSAETPAAEQPAAAAPAPDAQAAAQPPAAAETQPGQQPAADAQAPAVAAPASPATQAPATAETPPPADVAAQPSTEAPAAETAAPAAVETPAAVEAPAAVAETPAAGAPASEQPAASNSATPAPAQPEPVAPAAAEAPAPALETPASPPAVAEAPAAAEPPSSSASASDAPAAEPALPEAGEAEKNVAAAPAPQNELPAPPPAGVDEVLGPKLQSVDSAVIIRRGDTLWRISRRVYGRGIRYSTIYLANEKQIEDPDRIWPGQVFKVPEKSDNGEDADYSTLGDRLTTVPAEGEPGTPPVEAQQ